MDILAIDLSGHGRPIDLILSHSRTNNLGACLQILINDGHGNYSDQSTSRGGGVIASYGDGAIWSIQAIDLNGDGFVDLVLRDGSAKPDRGISW
jgi:hypothetical protein